jgi:PAS domain S-box-containing protein
MQRAFRTARPRRVAVLAAIGLACAGATIGACIDLHARAETATDAQISVLNLSADVAAMQTLPRTVQNAKSLAAVLTQLSDLGVRTQEAFGLLMGSGEWAELAPAMKINRAQIPYLYAEATFLSQNRLVAADRLAASREPYAARETKQLKLAEAYYGRAADRAATIADYSAIAAVLLAVIICAALFRRLVRSNETGKSSQAFAESILESSPDGIFAYDMDGRYAVWNRATEELTGLARADVIGRLPPDTPAGLVGGALEARKAALRGHRVELENVVINVPQSQGREMSVIYAPLFDEQGKIVGGLGHVRDVTERNALEQQVRQAQKLDAIGQLAGGIAHDFNNLLMGIRGYASLALQRAPENDSVLRHNLDEISKATTRARILTEQLLFFAGRRERRSDAVDLNALAREVTELLDGLVEQSVSIELDLHEPALVTGDAAQLEQVLISLGTNARDAMPDGGVLTIRTRPAGPDRVQLAVEDTGTGIPDDVKPHVFEPFFTSKGVGHGTGLGLSSAYGIVTQNGGSIELDSTVGQGTTFTITLATAAPDDHEPIAARVQAASEATATILLVEDEPVVRELIAAGLEDEGYTVIAQPAPAEALAFVEEGGAFDFLITDVVMPGFGGGELVERIRSAVGSCFDTIYISGYPASGITLDERSVFLQKPFELKELYAHVETVLLERGNEVLGSGRGVARNAG